MHEHLSAQERNEIEKYARRATSSERSLVRWIRDPRDRSIYIFVETPQCPKLRTQWQALNTNMAIDVYNCELVALPGA